MIYCFVKGLEFSNFLENSKQYCLENDMAIFYSKKEDIFVDKDGNIIDIKGMKIFPKTGVYESDYLCDAILNKGGIPIVTKEENHVVDSWPNYYKTKRKLNVFTGKELLDKEICESIKKEYGNEVFFKTLNKNYSEIIKVNYLIDHESVLSRTIKAHENDKFVISEVVNRKKDEIGNLEYRIFVIDGRIKNISRITSTVFHKIDKYVYDKVLEIIESLKNFPKSYVVDVFEYERQGKEEFDVVEFNSLPASGIYLYNSIIDFSEENMFHDDIYKIAVEIRDYLEKIKSFNNTTINVNGSKHFEDRGSFAYDLIGVYLFGFAGGMHFDGIKEVRSEMLGKHGCLMNGFVSSKNLTSDDRIYSEDDGSTELTSDSQFRKKTNN